MTDDASFQEALDAFRGMREDGSLDLMVQALGLSPAGLVEDAAEAVDSDATRAEIYALALLAGISVGQAQIADILVFAVSGQDPAASAEDYIRQAARDMADQIRRARTAPTGPTGPTGPGTSRLGRRPR